MKHDTVNCRFRPEDWHWYCYTCGKDASKKYPEPLYFPHPDHDRQRTPQCDGFEIKLSPPAFVRHYKLKEKSNLLFYLAFNPLVRGGFQRDMFRFARTAPVTWERDAGHFSVESVTDKDKIDELNFVLKTLRAETEAKYSKRNATIEAKKRATSA
jgi:hypothetical protein